MKNYKFIISYIGTEFIYWYIFKVLIGRHFLLIQNLRITNFTLLDRYCAYATHLRMQGLDPVLLITAITNCLGWLSKAN